MRSLRRLLPGGRAILAVDAILIAWTVVWIVVGVEVAHQLHGLSDLSTTVAKTGRAVNGTASLFSALANIKLPVIGNPFGPQIAHLAGQVQQAAQSAQRTGAATHDSIRSLSPLLGVAIAVIPSIPLLALYVPLRASRVSEARSLRDALGRDGGRDLRLRRYLAERALDNLPHRRLRALGIEPWHEPGEHRDALAAAELAHLGLPAPEDWDVPPSDERPPPRVR